MPLLHEDGGVRRALAIAAVVMSVALAALAPAAAAEDEAAVEIKARTYFASGEFKQALEIYARLYVETMHPTYLRNIGRCHQNLGDPDKAIASFREYLRKAKDLSPDQRAEIDGYIAEMEQLKRSNAARASTAPPAPAATDAPAVLVGPPAVAGSPARDAESGAFYTSPWFWVGVAVVVGGAVTAAVLLSADRSPTHGGLGVVDFRDLP
jgi:tetratricopeptide (TPR) repeat protein